MALPPHTLPAFLTCNVICAHFQPSSHQRTREQEVHFNSLLPLLFFYPAAEVGNALRFLSHREWQCLWRQLRKESEQRVKLPARWMRQWRVLCLRNRHTSSPGTATSLRCKSTWRPLWRRERSCKPRPPLKCSSIYVVVVF